MAFASLLRPCMAEDVRKENGHLLYETEQDVATSFLTLQMRRKSCANARSALPLYCIGGEKSASKRTIRLSPFR